MRIFNALCELFSSTLWFSKYDHVLKFDRSSFVLKYLEFTIVNFGMWGQIGSHVVKRKIWGWGYFCIWAKTVYSTRVKSVFLHLTHKHANIPRIYPQYLYQWSVMVFLIKFVVISQYDNEPTLCYTRGLFISMKIH